MTVKPGVCVYIWDALPRSLVVYYWNLSLWCLIITYYPLHKTDCDLNAINHQDFCTYVKFNNIPNTKGECWEKQYVINYKYTKTEEFAQ